MPPALKLSLDGFELRHHPLLRRDPPDDEGSVTDALPTEVSKTQEREGLWCSLSALLPGHRIIAEIAADHLTPETGKTRGWLK